MLAPLLTTRAERASIADFHWADVVISSGGGFTTDNYYFDHLLAGYGLGLALGKKMVILGQTLGPFLEERNLHAVGDVISRFDLVVVRDAQSLEIGRRMGIPEGVLALAADMTFNVPSPPTLEAPCSGPRPRIGVSVRKWSYPNSDAKAEHASYVARMAAALDLLIERTGAAITFLSTCQGEPAYPYRDDEVAAEIRRAMRLEGKTKIDVEFNTPQRFMSKIADFDMIIGTRMHACILAMLTGVPAVNVEYEFKSRELFRRMGLEDLVLGIATFTPEQLVCMVERVLGDRPSVAAKITAEIAQLRRLNAAAENRLGEILRG